MSTTVLPGVTARTFFTKATRQARFDAVLAERTRLAGELHDTVLQAFTAVTLQLQALRCRMLTAPHEAEQDLGRVLKIADLALRDARAAVWDMRAPELESRDVAAALEESAQEAVASHRLASGAPVDLEVTITGDRRRLPPAVEKAAHRIGREAVANALRHADAKHIRVAIAFESRHLCVDVGDDGVGFDVAKLQPTEGRGHWGLVGMRERARCTHATLDVNSSSGEGTAVLLRIPVAPA
jgi:signal transduction histidine kinase